MRNVIQIFKEREIVVRDKRCNKELLKKEIINEHGEINSTVEFIKEAEK